MTDIRITPFLWLDDNAEEAAHYYVGIFPDSQITQITHYAENMPKPPGSVMTVSFNLAGNEVTALNGGPAFEFNEAVSLVVHCQDQEEIDYYWEKLVEGGSAMACGWLKDRFGLAWQIVPAKFFEMIDSADPQRAGRVLAAMGTMVKFEIDKLEKAYRGN